MNRGSISTKMIKSMFKGDRDGRSPSRSRSPIKVRGDVQSPTRNQGYKAVDDEVGQEENFEIGADSDVER
jgi:hypothetical protein